MPNPIDELIHVTVRIQLHGPEEGVATGFLFSFDKRGMNGFPCVVTNKHVIEGATCGEIVLTRVTSDGLPDFGNERTIFIENFDGAVPHPDVDVDLVAIPLVPILRSQGVEIADIYMPTLDRSIIKTDEEAARLTAIEDVLMIGYPEGLWDEMNNVPLVRRGVTATPLSLDYDGSSQFLIDCAVFTGSSGSPVFLFNPTSYLEKDDEGGLVNHLQCRISLIGILWANATLDEETDEARPMPVPTSRRQARQRGTALHIGFCEKASSLRFFEDHFAALRPVEISIPTPAFSFGTSLEPSHSAISPGSVTVAAPPSAGTTPSSPS